MEKREREKERALTRARDESDFDGARVESFLESAGKEHLRELTARVALGQGPDARVVEEQRARAAETAAAAAAAARCSLFLHRSGWPLLLLLLRGENEIVVEGERNESRR